MEKTQKQKYTFFKKSNLKSRIWELDFFRGVCILMMVFDHMMFDFMYFPYWQLDFYDVTPGLFYKIVEFADFYWDWSLRVAFREAVVWLFIILSGISCSLSRSNTKRLLKLTVASLIITLFTFLADQVFDMDIFIAFGILHVIAASLLFYIVLQKVWDNKYFILAIGLIFIVIGINIDYFAKPYYYTLNLKKFAEVLAGTAFHGGDSYGLAPYLGVFLLGAFLGKTLYADKYSFLPMLSGAWQKPVSFVGRNTIWVYIVHQPLVYGITILFGFLSGYKIF